MKISTVIVTYNAELLIRDCLNALINSTVLSTIIVVDNCSTDSTVNIVRNEFPKVILIQNDKNKGFGQANNQGIQLAFNNNSDYVFLLNQDAFLKPDTLEILFHQAEKNSNYGILSPIHLTGDGTALDKDFSTYIENGNCPGFISDMYLDTVKELYPINFANAAAWLISRKCIETVGGFNPMFFMYGEDDEYCNRLKYHQFKIGICTGAKVNHLRQHSDNKLKVSAKRKHLQRWYFLARRVHLADINRPMRSDVNALLVDASKRILNNLIRLNFITAYLFLDGTLKIVAELKAISKNRKLCMQKAPTFLSVH